MLSVRLPAILLIVIFGPAMGATSPQYANIPLSFERHGMAPGAHYVAHGTAYTVDLDGGAARISVPGSTSAISMQFKGGSRPRANPEERLPGKANYFVGQDPSRWQLGLPTYRRVTYANVYPKIDVAYYGTRQQLEFDLLLRPGADPRKIRIKFDGAQSLRLDRSGTVLVQTPSGEFRLPLPAVYQEADGERRAITGHYAIIGKREIGFRMEQYDRTKALVIDPSLVWSNLIGGGYGTAVAADSNGNTYLTGYTAASDFPIVNATQAQLSQSTYSGFVTKLDPTGTTILYSTYLGGSEVTYLYGIAIDSTGAAWVTGWTASSDFPVMGAYQAALNGSDNAVVVKLDALGALQYATYFGLSGRVTAQGIAVDSFGSAYITGNVPSGGTVPTTSGAYLTAPQGGGDAFAAKFATGGALVYSTYLGGMGDEYGNAIAVDSALNAYVAGSTTSPSFQNAPGGGAQAVNQGGQDGFVAKLNSSGSALAYFTFVGGAGVDACTGIAVDANGNGYVTGSTSSANFPVTAGAFQPSYGGGLEDGFLAKLNNSGSAFVYASFLGGSRLDSADAVAIDAAGNAYVTGQTWSANFPTAEALQAGLPANQNSTSLFQTTDSGSSWSPFDTHIGGVVSAILPDPKTPGVIVVLSDSGVYRTVNGGATWAQTFTTPLSYRTIVLPGSISRSLADSDTIYLLFDIWSYRSIDGGEHWLAGGAVGSGAFLPGTPILADPLSANVAYVSGNATTLYTTIDGGATWDPSNTGLNIMFGFPPGLLASADGSLYMVEQGTLYKGSNRGTNWANIGFSGSSTTALAVSLSNPSVLYQVSGSNLYKTVDGGTTWTVISGNLPSAPGIIAVSPASPSLLYATASPAGLYISTDGGTTWNAAAAGLGLAVPSQIVFDPIDTSTAYVTSAAAQPSAFVAEVSPTGTSLIYSTYLGGSTTSTGSGIATAVGDAFVAGTSSGALPGSNLFRNDPSWPEAFVARITRTATSCTYTVNPLTQTIYSEAQSVLFTVVAPAGCAWTASSNQTWAAIVGGGSGSGSGVVDVSVPPNTSGQTQTATLTIAGQQATLIQAPSTCGYSLAPNQFPVSAAGGAVTLNLTTGAGCPWSVVNNDPLAITLVSGASGTGSGTINLTVGPVQAGQVRFLYVPIANSTIEIMQSGACAYTLSPLTSYVPASGGTGSITVTDTGSCSWTATGTTWLSVNSGQAGTGSGTVSYTVAPNTGAIRSFTFTIGGLTATVMQAAPQTFLVSTLAGGAAPATAAPALSASLSGPYGGPFAIAADAGGNSYFTSPNAVFRLDANGVLTRVAGTGSPGFSGDNGVAVSAQLNTNGGVAVDAAGNIYIADSGNNRIRKVSVSGIITTVAGSGLLGYYGDKGPATSARFAQPAGVAVDSAGNLFIADQNNQRVRKVDIYGTITTVAGNGTQGYSGDNGPAVSAQFRSPTSVAVDRAGNLYIADYLNNRIRKVSPGGTITTWAGNNTCCSPGDGGPATSAYLSEPRGIAVDASGNLFIADTVNNRICVVTVNGIISTVAGNGGLSFSGDGGPATSAALNSPGGVAVDPNGNLYIADGGNLRVRRVSAGNINTVAGGGTGDNGSAANAALTQLGGVARDGNGNTYISDIENSRVRKITPDGHISTVAGTGIAGRLGDGGPATLAQLYRPQGLAVDSPGNLYIADGSIRKVSISGVITTVAGGGGPTLGDGGPATSATLGIPAGVAVDRFGNLFIADTENSRVRKVDTAGIITTVAGTGVAGFSGDNGPATSAQLQYPESVAVDTSGNLYIADFSNNRIRKVDTKGIITTFAGTGVFGPVGDGGPATSATLASPYGVAVDTAGSVYIADTNHLSVREVTTNGVINTLAGGLGPGMLAVDKMGNVYVTQFAGSILNLLTLEGAQPVFSITSSHTGSFTPGSTGAYTVTVSNATGAGTTSGTVTVTDFLPAGLTLSTVSGTGWTCTGNTCTRTDALGSGSSYPPITVAANVSSNAPTQVTNQVLVSNSGAFAGAEDLTLINALLINETPSAPLLQGQTGTYTLTVSSQAGDSPTSGTLTVTETAPAGLTLSSISGPPPWTCPSGGNSCTRNDPLAGGASYPPITVTVSIASNAPAQVVNQVGASGGGALSANVANATNVYTLCDVNTAGSTNVSDIQSMVNQALGVVPAVNDLNLDGVVNVVDVQVAINSGIGLGCSAQ